MLRELRLESEAITGDNGENSRTKVQNVVVDSTAQNQCEVNAILNPLPVTAEGILRANQIATGPVSTGGGIIHRAAITGARTRPGAGVGRTESLGEVGAALGPGEIAT